MSTKEVKEYLSQHRLLDVKINKKLEEQVRLRELATKITPQSRIGGGGGGEISDRVGKTTARIIDLENEINDDIDKLLDLKAEITAVIKTVDDDVLQLILLMRYINLKKWEYIAEKLNIEIRWLYRLHGRALEKLKLTIESH